MIKVAFLTNDLENIDAHFGSAEHFVLYAFEENGFSLCKIINTDDAKTDGRIGMLKDESVDIMYCIEIGPAAAAKIVNNRIFPIKYKSAVNIKTELDKISAMLATNPPPFIKKMQAERV
ncbi:MAG: dinitrogenase iron-molybdenum cofactor biosynthesis protein [Campylobacteraceae bacterium]|jgi:nitrogen fixation protein NifX|nr:dinitrogenase iron-molybdenum cofactor biosynthesis protein [Campylobacteraceae bacterium]